MPTQPLLLIGILSGAFAVVGTVHPRDDRVARYEIVSPSDGPLLMSDDASTIG